MSYIVLRLGKVFLLIKWRVSAVYILTGIAWQNTGVTEFANSGILCPEKMK